MVISVPSKFLNTEDINKNMFGVCADGKSVTIFSYINQVIKKIY